MIDYFALALGHGLLAIALLRLVLRAGLDHDPLIGALQDETADNRKATSIAGRNAARRQRSGGDGGDGGGAPEEDLPPPPPTPPTPLPPRARSRAAARKPRAAAARR
jgi:hypothetical protein